MASPVPESPLPPSQPALPICPPPAQPTHQALPGSLQDTLSIRELFWHNVVREMLTSLSIMQIQGHRPELFDGRVSVLTHGGDRIPIGVVFPLFACSIPGNASASGAEAHAASLAVECTVFRIQSPEGQVFTLPVHEIRGLVSLTDDLIKQLEQASMNRTRGEGVTEAPGPFGFAAFLPRDEQEGEPGSSPPGAPPAELPGRRPAAEGRRP